MSRHVQYLFGDIINPNFISLYAHLDLVLIGIVEWIR